MYVSSFFNGASALVIDNKFILIKKKHIICATILLVIGQVKPINFKGFRFLGYLLPSSHTLQLTMVKRARLTRSSICIILLALDIGDGC